MKVLFWLAFIVIAYTYFGYPIVMYAWSRFASKPWRVAPCKQSISIVMAVHNGAALVREKVEALLALQNPAALQVIVASDGSTDGTNEILRTLSDPRLQVVYLEENRGKAAALNAAMQFASGDIVLFVDIRPTIREESVRLLMENFADPSVGCVAGELILHEASHDGTAKAVGGLYWKMEQWIREREAQVDSNVGVYGGFYAIRRELAVPFPEGLILDDMYEPLSIVRKGYRSVLDTRAIVVDTWPATAKREFHRKVRTLAGNFQLIELAPWTMTLANRALFQLVSHKILRLFVPPLLLVLLATSFALAPSSVFYTSMAVAQVVFYLLACAEFVQFRPLRKLSGPASALLMLNLAVVVAFYRYYVRRDSPRDLWVGKPTTIKSRAQAAN